MGTKFAQYQSIKSRQAMKQEKRTAFFEVERLIIDGSLYRGPEIRTFNRRIN